MIAQSLWILGGVNSDAKTPKEMRLALKMRRTATVTLAKNQVTTLGNAPRSHDHAKLRRAVVK
jgi:hypothetical protein